MMEQTTFEENEIRDTVNRLYGINVQKIERVNQGTANIYKLFSKKDQYILKEFQSKYSEHDVLKEIKAIKYLKENSTIPLPYFIKCKNGEFCFNHKGKTVIIQKFIDGYVYAKNEGTYEQLMESAYYLGKIIEGFEGFEIKDSMTIQELYSKEEFEKANRKYDEILRKVGNSKTDNKIKDDIIFKKQLLIEFQNNIDFEEMKLITHKISHGDYSSLQFIYDNDTNKVKAILDFIKVKKLPIIWEIARSYSYADKEAKNGQIKIKNLVDYTKTVAEVIKLNKYDLKYLPYVYLLQIARSPFGYEQYYKDVKNKEETLEFAFYRTNICRSLNEKAKEISNELLKLNKE